MPNQIVHPWERFEQDPERHQDVQELLDAYHDRLSELLTESVLLGKGNFADVYSIRGSTASDLGLVLKQYRKDSASITSIEQQKEFASRIPSAPRIWTNELIDGKNNVLMDEIPGVTLSTLPPISELPQSAQYGIASNLLRISDELKNADIRHNDLKPANLVINPAGELSTIDLDFATDLKKTEAAHPWFGEGHSPAFAPPESFHGSRGLHSDAFSMGATLIKAITGETLPELLEVPHGDNWTQQYGFYTAQREKMQEEMATMLHKRVQDPVLLSVLLQLLHTDPERRVIQPELRREIEAGAAGTETMRHILHDYSPKYQTAVRQWEERMGMEAEEEGFFRRWGRRFGHSWEDIVRFWKGRRAWLPNSKI